MQKKIFYLFVCYGLLSLEMGCPLNKTSTRRNNLSANTRAASPKAAAGAEALAKLRAGAACEEVEDLALKARNAPNPEAADGKTKQQLLEEQQLFVAEKLAKCEKWGFLFTQTALIGGKALARVMTGLIQNGHNAHAAYDAWLNQQAHPYYGVKLGNYAFGYAREWFESLDQTARKSHCPAFAAAIERTYAPIRGDGSYPALRYNKEWSSFYRRGFMGYLFVSDCKENIELARKMLTNPTWQDRGQACNVLAKWGEAKDKATLEQMAENDGFSQRKRGVMVWPVRDICRRAAAQIK